MKPIIMPQVGQDIPDAIISQWLKKENDRVEKGETVLIVESDKASFEVEAECSGILTKILHQEGERVEVFRPLGYISEESDQEALKQDQAGVSAEPAHPTEQIEVEGGEVIVPPVPSLSGDSTRERRASPSARRLARELGLSLSQIEGTGPGGRIIKRDVLAASAMQPSLQNAPQTTSVGDEVIVFDRTRKAIAEKLRRSKRTIPHFHLSIDVDMTDALLWRSSDNASRAVRITVTDLVAYAVAQTLPRFGRLNAHVEEDRLILRKSVNLGIAVAVEDSLVVPVIPDAASRSLDEIAEISRRNAEAARRGMVDPRHCGTFTISSLGMYGISRFLPIINPPECAILGVGCAERRVVPVPGGIGVRDMMTLDLACDHRAVDGAYAAGFLKCLKEFLEGIGRN
ncbi:MAG TPA: dihydrolipoamide acetyltransferase family protein [Acidobacteriota bacterium]|nr:dihydrolipoamide acetyltransferase family protein [Acidobacteriota bacterium]